jgi:S-adenosylmethionine hydrolase
VNTITVLTDFGLKDPYVGIMKGVMLSINPHLAIVDITHEVEAQDVREACFLLPEYYPHFSSGTVHLCVVDPGVGSARKPVVLVRDGHTFVGPDNGLFSLILDEAETTVHEISEKRFMRDRVSGTFHGRDIFAPAAAYLSLGVQPSEFGPPVADPERLDGLLPNVLDHVMTGEIVRFDRFGNAISNIHIDRFRQFVNRASFVVEIGSLSFSSLNRSYYEKETTCLAGSSGYLEFALFKGSFAASKGVRKGDEVTVRLLFP